MGLDNPLMSGHQVILRILEKGLILDSFPFAPNSLFFKDFVSGEPLNHISRDNDIDTLPVGEFLRLRYEILRFVIDGNVRPQGARAFCLLR